MPDYHRKDNGNPLGSENLRDPICRTHLDERFGWFPCPGLQCPQVTPQLVPVPVKVSCVRFSMCSFAHQAQPWQNVLPGTLWGTCACQIPALYASILHCIRVSVIAAVPAMLSRPAPARGLAAESSSMPRSGCLAHLLLKKQIFVAVEGQGRVCGCGVAERPGESHWEMWALHLGLVPMHIIWACVRVNAVYVQTGNCCPNQSVEQRYFGVKILANALLVSTVKYRSVTWGNSLPFGAF